MFYRDITSYMAAVPIVFALGIAFVCFYITSLVFSLESRMIWLADRYDLLYKIIFSVTLIILVVRSFLGDFASEQGTALNVPVPIIALALLSGLITWFTPKIKDNDNNEF